MLKLLDNRNIRLLLLAAAVGMGIWGWMNFGDYVELSHEEKVVWQEYEPGQPAGTCVRLTVQEEQPWLVTSVSEDMKTGFGANSLRYKLYHIYGYAACTDVKGQPVLLQTTEVINDMTELRSEFMWRSEFRDDLRAYAGSVQGNEVYGQVAAFIPDQELDFSYYTVGMPSITYENGEWAAGDDEMGIARERMAALADYTVVVPFRDGPPETVTVSDGTDFVPGPGRWWMGAATLLLLLLGAKEITLSAFWRSGKSRRKR